MTIARKQDPKCSKECQFAFCYMHLELKGEFKEEYRKVKESKVWIGL